MAEKNATATVCGIVNKPVMKFTDLPFVHRRPWNGTDCGSNWHVTPTADYHEACTIGREWGDRYLQYVRENAEDVGSSLSSIVAGMATVDGEARGYAVGFLTRLECEIARLILSTPPRGATAQDAVM